MIDDTKSIRAKDIVDNPDDVYGFTRSHILIADSSINTSFSNLMDAINIMYDMGWELVNTHYYSTTMSAIMRNTNYKRKNG